MISDMIFKGKRISIVGAGVSGSALSELAARLGAYVFVSDSKTIGDETKKLFTKIGAKWKKAETQKPCLTPILSW